MTKREREKDVTHAEIQLRVLESFSDLRPTPLDTSDISSRLIRNDTRLPTTPIQISTSLFHKKRQFFFFSSKKEIFNLRNLPLLIPQPSHLLGRPQHKKTNHRQQQRASSQKQRNTSPRRESSVLLRVGSNTVHGEIADDAEACIGGLEEEGT